MKAINEVVILGWDAPSVSDRAAHRIAAFLGADATLVALSAQELAGRASVRGVVPECACLIANVETLAEAARAIPNGLAGLSELIADAAKNIFVYGFTASEPHVAILRLLSSDALVGVLKMSKPSASFSVTGSSREWCGQFSGLSVRAADPTREHQFVEGPVERSLTELIRLAGLPYFVRTAWSGSQAFLVCGSVADLEESVLRNSRPLSWFSRLMPLMMFLRGALGDRVWHGDAPRACLIIDDPLLKQRYGFLEYRRLMETMRRRKFSTSIAFIPWNYRRSQRDVAALFASSPDAPSLCVHGCDHTDSEFATTDFDSLHGKAHLALERMGAHHRLSGVPFDDVMVFPQGRFTSEAVAALNAAGYLATVNGDVCPRNVRDTWVLRDLLEVAVTRFADFPLFSRRYPRDLAEFAFDLFVGKPALAVEHHGYFQSGYGELESFVDQLNRLDERLEWTSLAKVCSRAHLTKTAADGTVHVRFYTRRFSYQNNGTEPRTYWFLRRQAASNFGATLAVDGRECAWQREDDYLKTRLTLKAGETVNLAVSSTAGSLPSPSAWRPTSVYTAKVFARRVAGELRDNYVDTTRVFVGRLIS